MSEGVAFRVTTHRSYMSKASLLREQLPEKRLVVVAQHVEYNRILLHELVDPLERTLLEDPLVTVLRCLLDPPIGVVLDPEVWLGHLQRLRDQENIRLDVLDVDAELLEEGLRLVRLQVVVEDVDAR
eukprot:7752369-Pyramimonas_sp.AAC.1